MNIFEYAQHSKEELFSHFESSDQGLNNNTVQQHRITYGVNQTENNQRSAFAIFLNQFRSSFIYLLIFAGLLSLFLQSFAEGFTIFIFVIINAALGFYQEYHAEKIMVLLKKYLIKHAKVLRNGVLETIEMNQLVPGDIIVLEPGDTIPADIRFLSTNMVLVDESMLTGESMAVSKSDMPVASPINELHQAVNLGFMGTAVLQGKARAIVIATGPSTSIGNIATLTMRTIKESNFSKEIARFSHFIIVTVIVTLIILFCLNLIIRPTTNVVSLLLFCIALVVTIVPELLPLIITFCFYRGALKLAKHSVVVKRLSALEDLGSIDILCTDKTGTLTQNVLTVTECYGTDQEKLLEYACLAAGTKQNNIFVNPFDNALFTACNNKKNLTHYIQIKDIPFDPLRLRNGVIVQYNNQRILIVRGVFELVIQKCQPTNNIDSLQEWVNQQGNLSNRVLALAYKTVSELDVQELANEHDLQFLGLISFSDPLKSDVMSAVIKAQRMGVQIKILTGDALAVAAQVGKHIGLISQEKQLTTGLQWDNASDEQKNKMAHDAVVFARVNPQQKFEIIQTLQRQGYKVGYMGDGINDAPALKVADVSLVVQGAADIARDAADIILLHKSLYVMVNGIYQGRVVFSNIIKYIKITLASTIGNFYSVAFASLFVNFLPMLPLQILLINVLSDFPLLAISTDFVDSNEVKKPNSYITTHIFGLIVLLILINFVLDFCIFKYFYDNEGRLQTAWFVENILSELVLIYSLRTKKIFYKAHHPSKALLFLSLITVLVTLTIPNIGIGQKLFHFVPVTLFDFIFIIFSVLLYFCGVEVLKYFYYHCTNPKNIDK